MFLCPHCRKPLARVKAPRGVYWRCRSCTGRAVTVPLLRRLLVREYVNQVWAYARDGKGVVRHACPACRGRMIDVPVVYRTVAHWLDVCTRCQLVWFDPREYEAARAQAAPAVDLTGALLPKARRSIAAEYVRRMEEEKAERNETVEMVGEWREIIPGMFGLPVEESAASVVRPPLATWSLAAIVALVSLVAMLDLERAAASLGFVSADPWRGGGLTVFTSFLVHGGIVHLVGNLYFLVSFGDNVEDFLGPWRFLLLLAVATAAGAAVHAWGDPRTTVPCIGASGGIAGVIVFYALRFPKARLKVFVRWRYLCTIPAWGALAFWTILQVVVAYLQVKGHSSISGLAHLGGAAAGAAMWAACRTRA